MEQYVTQQEFKEFTDRTDKAIAQIRTLLPAGGYPQPVPTEIPPVVPAKPKKAKPSPAPLPAKLPRLPLRGHVRKPQRKTRHD